MSELGKLTQDELTEVKANEAVISKAIYELGQLHLQKELMDEQYTLLESETANTIKVIKTAGASQKELMDSFQKKYGVGNLDLETGTITPLN